MAELFFCVAWCIFQSVNPSESGGLDGDLGGVIHRIPFDFDTFGGEQEDYGGNFTGDFN